MEKNGNCNRMFWTCPKIPKAVVDTRLILLVRRICKEMGEQCSANLPVLFQNVLCVGIFTDHVRSDGGEVTMLASRTF